MKIYFLGTCAGTEPMPDRKHASVAIECGNSVYWFDAGESCSATAHILGVDLLKVRQIVISHTHMDHVGGLGNLLWNIRKLVSMRKQNQYHGAIDVHIPNMETWNGVWSILRNTEGEYSVDYKLEAHEMKSGLLFEDDSMRVTAFPNNHLKDSLSGKCLSYSFLIECEGKRIVYSGDVGQYSDMDEVIGNGCDALIIETGHFSVDTACDYVAQKAVDRVFFSHNGREILADPQKAQNKVREKIGNHAVICEDGMIVEL